MAPNEKKPTTLRTPWPPTDHLLKTQPVTGADDWRTLQRTFKRCDVWDIIYYNFATYDPAEVNWYLRERIGCHDVSPTGRNFRFGLLSGGRPMQVYIPTDDWLPPGPQQAAAKQAALDILRDPVASAMAYKAGPLELKPLDFAGVALAIETGKITVVHRPCLGHIAQYLSGSSNTMLIPFSTSPPLGMRALMVHEATHAAMDVRKVPLVMQQSEAMGYISQAIYLLRNGVDLGASVPSPPFMVAPRNFVAFTGIFKFAASIAKDVVAGANVSTVDLVGLGVSLTAAPMYTNQGNPVNDGV